MKDVLGDNIKVVRLCDGLTQDDLAKRTGVTSAYISHVEQGFRKPSEETLKKIAKALGVEVAWLKTHKGAEKELRSKNKKMSVDPIQNVVRRMKKMGKKEKEMLDRLSDALLE